MELASAAALIDRAFLYLAFRTKSAAANAERELFAEHRHEATQLYREADLFVAPPPARFRERGVRKLRGGRVVDVSWRSTYQPLHAQYASLLAAVPNNNVVRARWFRHDRPAPALICLHGWAGGYLRIEELIFRASAFYRAGYDVILPVLPFHAARAGSIGRPIFPGADAVRANEGLAQLVSDVRALIFAVRERGAQRVAVAGASLGGFSTALLATVEPTLHAAIPILPFGSLPEMVWHLGDGTEPRRRQEAQGVGVQDFAAAFEQVTPLARRPVVRREKILFIAGEHDRVVPLAHTRRLRDHFAASLGGDIPLLTFSGTHLWHTERAKIFAAMTRVLAAA
jgi:dienelactone hydrolase